MWKIQLSELNYDKRELINAQKVIENRWLTLGEKTFEFEKNFEIFLGNNVICTAVSSCTAALHLALIALDIKQNDEVIIPALTFVANANVVKMVGASPILADSSSLNDLNLSLETIKNKVTSKTKAIIIVHFAGYPCDIQKIVEFCNKRNIWLIEDVAHAPGATFNRQKCGTFGDIGCFSFFSNKNIATGEGGMLSTSNKKISNRLKSLRSHGMSSLTLDRHKGRAISYDVITPGLNYRIDEIRSSIGLVQLEKLLDGNEKREKLTSRYMSNLNESEILIPFKNLSNEKKSAYHIMPIILPKNIKRSEIIKFLKNMGIQTSIHYPAFWNFSGFSNQFSSKGCPNATEICNRELTLPLFPHLKFEQVDYITKILLEALKNDKFRFT